MSEPFLVRPDSITEGTPVTIEVRVPFLKDRDVLTIKDQASKNALIHVPIKSRGDKDIAEFSIYKAGTYAISLNDYKKVIQVAPQKDLSFSLEFGILGSFVIFILGGLIVWNLKKRHKNAGGSS